MEKVAIFVDVQNIYYTTRQAFHRQFNYREIWSQVTKNRELVVAFAYAIEPSDAKQKGFQQILKDIGFDVKLKPIKIDLLTTIATLTDNIELKNHSHLSVKGHLGFRSKAEPIAMGLVKSTDGIKLSFYYEVSKKGHYSVKLSSPKVIDLSYLSWRCFQKREGSSSEFSNGLFELKEDQEQNITINVDCYIFDLAQGVNFTDSFEYRVTNESTISETWTKIMKIDPLSRAKFTQPAMSISPGEYEAFFESSQGARIPLGDIIFYP